MAVERCLFFLRMVIWHVSQAGRCCPVSGSLTYSWSPDKCDSCHLNLRVGNVRNLSLRQRKDVFMERSFEACVTKGWEMW